MPEKMTVDPVPETPNENESKRTALSQPGAAPAAPANGSIFANPKARLVLVILVLLVIAGVIYYVSEVAGYETTDDAQVDGHLMPLSARVGGYVQKVSVDDNQYVTQGATLVEIDPKDYQVAVDKAKADLADAVAQSQAVNQNVPITSANTSSQLRVTQSGVENANAGITVAEKQFLAAKAQLEEAEANDVRDQDDLARYKQLVDKQEISQQLYDQSVAAAKASNAGVAAARANAAAADQAVNQAHARLAEAQANQRAAETAPQQNASTRARAQAAEAAVQQKQAALEQAELNLQYTKIAAPVNGIVTKNVEVGMNVQPGQQLVAVVPLDDVWITANFKETQLRNMRPGQPVEIRVDANGRTYRAHVDSIAGTSGSRMSLIPPENATGNYVKVVQRLPVKLVLEPGENSDHSLRLGMSVDPKVKVK